VIDTLKCFRQLLIDRLVEGIDKNNGVENCIKKWEHCFITPPRLIDQIGDEERMLQAVDKRLNKEFS
jgi:hypothetical protein